MVKKIDLGKGPFVFNIVFNLISLGIAMMVLNFMNDLASHPQCKSIDPVTREGLTGYIWLVIIVASLSALLNLYIIIFV
jgi:hypothetical protein